MQGMDSLHLLVQRLQDGPKAAKAAVRASMGDAAMECFGTDKLTANRPTSALRQQRTRMYEELKKMQAPGPRSKSNGTLREREQSLSDVESPKSVHGSSPMRHRTQSELGSPGAFGKSDLERVPSGARVTEPVVDLEQNLSFKSAYVADFTRSEVQARPATRDCTLIAPDVLAQQRKALRDKVLAGNREGARSSKGGRRQQKNVISKAPVLSGSTSAPCLSKHGDLPLEALLEGIRDAAPDNTLPPAAPPEAAREAGHASEAHAADSWAAAASNTVVRPAAPPEATREAGRANESQAADNAWATGTAAVTAARPSAAATDDAADDHRYGSDRCGSAPAKARPAAAWSVPVPKAAAPKVDVAACSAASTAAKETPTAWAAPSPAATAPESDAAAATASAATDAPAQTPAATASALSTVPGKEKPQSTKRDAKRSRQSAEAKIAAALGALDLQAEALLEAAMGKRSQYQKGKPLDIVALLAEAQRGECSKRARPAEDEVEADASGGRVPQFFGRGRERGTRNKQSAVEKEKLGAARLSKHAADKANPCEQKSSAKPPAEKQEFDGDRYLAQTDKMIRALNEMESPSMFETYLPASALDLMELDHSKDVKFERLSSSKTKPSKLVNALEELPYSVPFDMGTWEKSAPDMFGANLLEPQKANSKSKSKSKSRDKVARKSKKSARKESARQVECSVQTDIMAPANASNATFAATLKALSSMDSSAAATDMKPKKSAETKEAEPERQRPKSATESGGTRLPLAVHKAADAPATVSASAGSNQQDAHQVPRPSSAAASRETLARLGGFDMPESSVPYSTWETCKEVYSVWGDNDQWEDTANDWGMDDVSMQLLVF